MNEGKRHLGLDFVGRVYRNLELGRKVFRGSQGVDLMGALVGKKDIWESYVMWWAKILRPQNLSTIYITFFRKFTIGLINNWMLLYGLETCQGFRLVVFYFYYCSEPLGATGGFIEHEKRPHKNRAGLAGQVAISLFSRVRWASYTKLEDCDRCSLGVFYRCFSVRACWLGLRFDSGSLHFGGPYTRDLINSIFLFMVLQKTDCLSVTCWLGFPIEYMLPAEVCVFCFSFSTLHCIPGILESVSHRIAASNVALKG